MAKILIINPNQQHAIDLKFLLALNGYQTEVCVTLEEGINRFQIFQHLDNRFDLVLLVADGDLLTKLDAFEDDPFSGRLMVIDEGRRLKQGANLALWGIPICEPRLAIDCVKYRIEESEKTILRSS